MGYPRSKTDVDPNFNSSHNYRNVTKSAEQVTVAGEATAAVRRAFSRARNGRPRPTLVEFPRDVFGESVGEYEYDPTTSYRTAPDPDAVPEVADVLLDADRPVLYAGQGVHYAQAWESLREFAELLEAPVATSLQGKSSFPETHPLSLGAGGKSKPKPVVHFLEEADVIFGIGCSFADTRYGVSMPAEPTVIHATLDPSDVDKDTPSDYALVGDAELTLGALLDATRARLGGEPRGRFDDVASEIRSVEAEWMAEWEPKLTSDEVPLSPYRVLHDLMETVDRDETIITHDSGSPRDQMVPFWKSTTPLSYIGWGKSTQLGYGLGLTMGAKLANPEKLCINVWGDAAIGMTGMDFETAVREEIPILSVLFNNFSMAIEIPALEVATEEYGSTDITGNYADVAEAFGGYGERVESPDDVVPAIRRGIEKTEEGVPALLEFVTAKEIEFSLA
jgi:acetolactate synthase-1/2/3 large subunit